MFFENLLTLYISPDYCVANISLSGSFVLTFHFRASFLLLNGMSLMWLITWLGLYPLCFSLCISLRVIDLKLVPFELVLRYFFFFQAAVADTLSRKKKIVQKTPHSVATYIEGPHNASRHP